MKPTIFTFVMSLIWCNAFILIAAFLRRKRNFLCSYGVLPLAVLMLSSLFRLAFTVELPYTVIVNSDAALPAFLKFIRVEMSIGGLRFSIAGLLIALWIAVSAVLILRIIAAQTRLNRALSKISPVRDARAASAAGRIIRGSRPGQKFRLLVSDEINMPMITGLFTPVIMLPVLPATDEELEYIIQHEWNHFIHKDLWIKLLVEIVCAVFWWNPLVYILKKDLNLILEMRSDLKITSGLDEPERLKYLSSALNVMNHVKLHTAKAPGNSLGFAVGTGEGGLEQRFKLVLANPPRLNKKYAAVLSVFIISSLLFSYAFVIQPDSEPDDGGESFTLDESAYLVDNGDGTYSVYMNNENVLLIKNGIDQDPFSSMPIMERVK